MVQGHGHALIRFEIIVLDSNFSDCLGVLSHNLTKTLTQSGTMPQLCADL